MRTICKYTLSATDKQSLSLPDGATILCVSIQSGCLCLWAEVFTASPLKQRTIYIVGTGNPMPTAPTHYIGTEQIGPYVWHVYEGI